MLEATKEGMREQGKDLATATPQLIHGRAYTQNEGGENFY